MSFSTRVVGSPARGPAVPRRRVQRALEVKNPLVEGENPLHGEENPLHQEHPATHPKVRRQSQPCCRHACHRAGLETYN
jgi:hypothetical protein